MHILDRIDYTAIHYIHRAGFKILAQKLAQRFYPITTNVVHYDFDDIPF